MTNSNELTKAALVANVAIFRADAAEAKRVELAEAKRVEMNKACAY